MDGPTRTAERPTAGPAIPRHLRWLLPLALASLVLVVALVDALHQTSTMSGTTMIQTAGFFRPPSATPVRFSLRVLQQASDPRHTGGARSVSMASLHGEPVVLNMWSSSCTICKAETPAMESVARRVTGVVDFVGVDTLDQRGTALQFLHRYHVTYLQLSDPGEMVGSGYGIPGLPVTVFVSSRGKVVGEYLGALSTKTLVHYLGVLFRVGVPGI